MRTTPNVVVRANRIWPNRLQELEDSQAAADAEGDVVEAEVPEEVVAAEAEAASEGGEATTEA